MVALVRLPRELHQERFGAILEEAKAVGALFDFHDGKGPRPIPEGFTVSSVRPVLLCDHIVLQFADEEIAIWFKLKYL